jgi:hypothetical protein
LYRGQFVDGKHLRRFLYVAEATGVIRHYVRFVQKDEAAEGAVVGYVCGQVNAKNAFGAYAGFAPFEMELSMKSKGFFSKGVSYSVFNK